MLHTRGTSPLTKRAIENIDDKPFGRNLEPKQHDTVAPPPTEADKAADEVEKLWDKLTKFLPKFPAKFSLADAAAKGDPKAIVQAI